MAQKKNTREISHLFCYCMCSASFVDCPNPSIQLNGAYYQSTV